MDAGKLKRKENMFLWMAYARIVSEITIILGMFIILYLILKNFF